MKPTNQPRRPPHTDRGRKKKKAATPEATAGSLQDRLQKVMAAGGLGSRRALEKRITVGEVAVDGRRAALGQSVSEGAVIAFDSRSWRVVGKSTPQRTLIYNKPEGEVTSRSDPEGRRTVFDHLPPVRDARWVAIGRLDINTTGLLLLTTDGELANRMMHPSSEVDREYACRIRGEATAEQLEQLRNGVELDDGPASFSDIQEAGGSGENHWYHVTILEGRNREVRRLWESQGLAVSRLKRVRYGAAFLPRRLRMGKWAEITPREHEILREDVGLPATAASLTLQEIRPPRGRAPKKGKPRTTRAQPDKPGRTGPRRSGKPQARRAKPAAGRPRKKGTR